MILRVFKAKTESDRDTVLQTQYRLRFLLKGSSLRISVLTLSIILFTCLSAHSQALSSFGSASASSRTAPPESTHLRYGGNPPAQLADAPLCAFFLPAAGYSFDGDLKHGAVLGLQMAKAARNCDCTGPWGGLCFFVGTTYELNAAYFPSTKTTEGSFGFRYRYIFFAGGLTGGYASSSEQGLPEDHFFIRPSLTLDLLVGQITVGYTIRTKEIYDSQGSFRVGLTLSPFSLNNSSAYRSSVKRVMKSTKAERSELRQSLRN